MQVYGSLKRKKLNEKGAISATASTGPEGASRGRAAEQKNAKRENRKREKVAFLFTRAFKRLREFLVVMAINGKPSAGGAGDSVEASSVKRRSTDSAAPKQKQVSFEVTVFDKTGGILTKRISLSKDGTLIKDGSACSMKSGTAKRVPITDVHDYAKLIERLKPYQALALGVIREGFDGGVNVVVKKKLNGQANTIARSGDYIVFRPKQPALALLDYDSEGASEKIKKRVREEGFWEVLCSVQPALEGTGRVVRYSTSSGLFNSETGEKLQGSDGMHVFPTIADGADCERFLETLHDLCWLNGLGWIRIGDAGQLLDRSIIDITVGRPERLVFEASADVVKPLKQDASTRKPIAIEGKLLNTKKAVPSLTKEEQQKVDKLKATERERLKPQAEKVCQAWAAKRAPEMAKRTGKSVKECTRILLQQTEGVLLPDVELYFTNPELKGATVGDVLADPERFDGEVLADPLEGTNYGHTTAKVYVNVRTGEPWVRSFAHGGMKYTLCWDEDKKTADDRRAKQVAANIEIGDEIMDTSIVPTVHDAGGDAREAGLYRLQRRHR